MRVLVAGGTGFMGQHLIDTLTADNHQVWVLSRHADKKVPGAQTVQWDGKTAVGWGQLINETDAVINLAGLSLYHWPWTEKKKQKFLTSRLEPGHALAAAIQNADRRPGVFVQISGINYYGLRGEQVANEFTPPADDYLAQLAVDWENATKSVEEMGVRRVVCRTAVILAKDAVLAFLLALPVRLFVGGPLGSGKQALPWIHIEDQISAIKFLLENESASGPFNLIAPQAVSNAEFMRTEAKVLHRPYWFPVPTFLFRLVLGEMSLLVTEGRFTQPKKLLEAGYTFRFPNLKEALEDLYS